MEAQFALEESIYASVRRKKRCKMCACVQLVSQKKSYESNITELIHGDTIHTSSPTKHQSFGKIVYFNKVGQFLLWKVSSYSLHKRECQDKHKSILCRASTNEYKIPLMLITWMDFQISIRTLM